MAARRDDEHEGSRDPWEDGPKWLRLTLQTLVVLVALSVWTYSTLDAIHAHKEPNLTTFGLFGASVLLVYGQQIARWWRK